MHQNHTRPTMLLVRGYEEHEDKWNKRVARVLKALEKDVEITLLNRKVNNND